METRPSDFDDSIPVPLPDSPALTIERAAPDDLPRIENLMQFYNYDLSEWTPVAFAHEGRYQLRPKAPYWAQEDVHPFLIWVGDELAGFAVVDGEFDQGDSDHKMGYFFLGRGFRGDGVAARAYVTAGASGLVVSGFAYRGRPHRFQLDALHEAVEQGVAVVLTSRGGNGRVPVEAGDGVVRGDNLSATKARILLMLALTTGAQGDELQRIFDSY